LLLTPAYPHRSLPLKADPCPVSSNLMSIPIESEAVDLGFSQVSEARRRGSVPGFRGKLARVPPI